VVALVTRTESIDPLIEWSPGCGDARGRGIRSASSVFVDKGKGNEPEVGRSILAGVAGMIE
jgi:hypothetical protein